MPSIPFFLSFLLFFKKNIIKKRRNADVSNLWFLGDFPDVAEKVATLA